MKIAVCDDDKNFAGFMHRLISLYSSERNNDLEVYSFTSSKKLLGCERKFDIAVLDVEMKDINGIELGKKLRERNRELVLMYITSHKEYLDEALNINAARFFEKPIDPKRFYDGLDSVIRRIEERTVKIFVKEKNKIIRIDADDIIYIEIEQTGHRKTNVVTKNGEYISANKMSYWEERLLNPAFVRTHKSYMVNLNYVIKYEYNSFELSSGYTVPISRSYQTAVHRRFVKFTEDA